MNQCQMIDNAMRNCRKCANVFAQYPVDPRVNAACVEPRPIVTGILPKPVMLIGLKRLIDDGFNLPLGAALALEQERSIQHNRAVTPAAVEARGVLSPSSARVEKSGN